MHARWVLWTGLFDSSNLAARGEWVVLGFGESSALRDVQTPLVGFTDYEKAARANR